MTSNQLYPEEEMIVPIMPDIGEFDIGEETERLESVLREAKKPANGSAKRPKIQRVSSVLKGVKADFIKCFEPRLVALGPFHHGNPKFQRSQQVKFKFAALFAEENGTTGGDLFNKIKAEIHKLKEFYYPEDIKDYNDDELAWMFFVDGSAVLYAVHYGMQNDFKKLGTKADRLVFAQLDLFLLENQLPYRVLEILIGSAKDRGMWEKSITDFLDINLMTNIQSGKRSQEKKDYSRQHKAAAAEEKKDDSYHLQQPTKAGEEEMEDCSHLLQLLRNKHLRGPAPAGKRCSCSTMIGKMLLWCGDKRGNKKTFRSIMELKEYGVCMKPSKSNNLKNISFYCNLWGSLEMPRLMVDDSTASKFMNLVALEMCPDFDNDFALTSYLSFMDSLIDTAEDVKELRVTGMLHNYLGSDEEVADLFNRMSKDLVPDQEIYSDVVDNIYKYCNNLFATTVVKACYTHFSSPWSFLASLAAIMGLIFTAIQAYYVLFPRSKYYETP